MFIGLNVGVFVVFFIKGFVEEIFEVFIERDFVSVFGEFNDYNYEYWFIVL